MYRIALQTYSLGLACLTHKHLIAMDAINKLSPAGSSPAACAKEYRSILRAGMNKW